LYALHVDLHIPADGKTIVRSTARDMGCICTSDECFCGNASGVHTRSTELMPLNNRDGHARRGKARSQWRTGLACPDDDGIEMPRHEAPPLRKIDATT